MKKEELFPILDSGDWESLIRKAKGDPGVARRLMNRIFIKDGLQFWRAIEGMGKVAQAIEKEKPGYAVELVRRYFWALNDESGGTAWNASAAIGSIVAHNPKECGHFNWMLSGLIEDESLQEGALWGLAQIALAAPDKVYLVAERVLPMLEAESAQVRGLAAWVFALMQPLNLGLWKVSDDLGSKLEQDPSQVEVYLNGNLQQFTVSELFKFKKKDAILTK